MSEKQKLFFIVAFSVLGVLYILTKFIHMQRTAEVDKELRAAKDRQTEATERATAVAERTILAIEIDKFNACNGNIACENLYPAAKAAIKAAEEKQKEKPVINLKKAGLDLDDTLVKKTGKRINGSSWQVDRGRNFATFGRD